MHGSRERVIHVLPSCFTQEDINAFTTRVNDIVGHKLASYSNAKFNSMGPDTLYAELVSEMDRCVMDSRPHIKFLF